MESRSSSLRDESPHGSHDGGGAADNDQPYTFGRSPRAIAPYPFSTREFARLLVLRSRLRESGPDCR